MLANVRYWTIIATMIVFLFCKCIMYVFCWEDQFLLNKELQRRKSGFEKKFWPDHIVEYWPDNRDKDTLVQAMFGQDLFSQKKCIILYGIPQDTKTHNKLSTAHIQRFEDTIIPKREQRNTENILISVSYKPDKRKKLYKRCKKHCDVKEFDQLKEKELVPYVQERCWGNDVCSPKLAQFIIALVGNNTWRLWNETQKLVQYMSVTQQKLSEEMITTIVFSTQMTDTFGILDAVLQDKKKAIALVQKAYHNGENRNMMMWALLRWTKNMLLFLAARRAGKKSTTEIASYTKTHPFTIRKYLADAELFAQKQQSIKTLFEWFLDIDYSIKTWRLPDIHFWLETKKMLWRLF